jgi:hypothetical protein
MTEKNKEIDYRKMAEDPRCVPLATAGIFAELSGVRVELRELNATLKELKRAVKGLGK